MRPFIFVTFFLLLNPLGAKLPVRWPTDHPPVDMQQSFFSLLQATESEETQSGNFGCVRTDGTQFHEGIDLRTFSRDSRGESRDSVRSVLPGVVIYTNLDPSKSSFGRYILIEHSDGEIVFITLYAHLSAFEKGIARGDTVKAGQKIGTMGRSASYTIPKDRAHLHFEVCLRLTDQFQNWYDWMEFDDPNDHGIYNGMNLIGLDPVHFFEQAQWQHADNFLSVLEAEETAFTIVVSTRQVPDFVKRYPALMNGEMPEYGLAGWRIEFSWYGAPKKWTPLVTQKANITEGKLALESYDKALVLSDSCRGMLRFHDSIPAIGPGLQTSLQLLFGFR